MKRLTWLIPVTILVLPSNYSHAGWKIKIKKPRITVPRVHVGPIKINVPKVLSPEDVVHSTERMLGNGVKQATKELRNGTKILTETIPNVGTRTYEIISKDAFKVTESLAGGVERVIEASAEGVHIVEKLPGQLRREVNTAVDGTVNIILEDGSRIVTGVTEDGVHVVSEAWQDGSRRATEILKDGTTKVTEVVDGATQVTVFISEAALNAKAEAEEALSKAERLSHDAASECVEVAKTAIRFQERQINGYVDAASEFEKRVREGKVVDAVWGGAVEPLRGTSRNAAIATQENKYVAIAGAIAASTYGGPAGAAAYASWSTYEATGDAGMAMKAGLIAGVSASVSGQIGEMPAVTKTDIALKACAVAAKNGIEAAARKGSKNDIEKAMLDGMLTSAAAATSTSVEALKASDDVTRKAFAAAAEAAANAIANNQRSDIAVKNALLGAMAESICQQVNEATGDTEKLSRLHQAIMTGTVKGIGTAALGGDPEQALNSIVNDSGKIIVQDAVDLAKESLADALENNTDVRAVQAFGSKTLNSLNEHKKAAEEQFRALQRLDFVNSLELQDVKRQIAQAKNDLHKATVELPGAGWVISATRSTSDLLHLAGTDVALVNTAANTRYAAVTSSLVDEVERKKAIITNLTRVPYGEKYDIKPLATKPTGKGVEVAEAILSLKVPAPAKSGGEPPIVSDQVLKVMDEEVLTPFRDLR